MKYHLTSACSIIATFFLVVSCNSTNNEANINDSSTSAMEVELAVLPIAFLGNYHGVQPGYYMKNKNGDDVIIKGNKISIPSVGHKFLISENNSLSLQLTSLDDNSRYYYEGNYTVTEESIEEITIDCKVSSQDGSSNPTFTIVLDKENKTARCLTAVQSTFVLKKVENNGDLNDFNQQGIESATIRQARIALDVFSEIIVTNDAYRFDEVFEDYLTIYHSSEDRTLKSVVESTERKYFSKWIVMYDKVLEIAETSEENKFLYEKLYRIRRKSDLQEFKYEISGFVYINPETGKIYGIEDTKTDKVASFDNRGSVSNVESRITDFYVKVKEGRDDINIREVPTDGRVVGRAEKNELYHVSRIHNGSTIHILNRDMILTCEDHYMDITKSSGYKLLSILSETSINIRGKVLDDRGRPHIVRIPKDCLNKVNKPWYFLDDEKGWVLSIFFEAI
ncbi:MAG: hypothetical protein ACKVGT_08780 [Flavobacteriales bacterium]